MSEGPGKHYVPYISEDDESVASAESESGSESDYEMPPEHVVQHDGRMQAMDQWRASALQWISGPGRATVSDTVLPIHAPPAPKIADATDIPAELRANDIRQYILHVDSRFREAGLQSTAADFYFRPIAPLKNILRVRVVSMEMPYSYPFFVASRFNVSIVINWSGGPTVLTIADGNYSPAELAAALTGAAATAGLSWLSVSYIAAQNRFVFSGGTTAFSVDTGGSGTIDRPFDYGLGYYLGFRRGVTTAVADGSGNYVLAASGCAIIGGDNYVFLKINDFDCLRQTVSYVTPTTAPSTNEFTALAKIRLRADRNSVAYDDYAGGLRREVVFQNPRDIPRLHVQVLDAYGSPVNLCTAEFSFALEVLEIQSTTLFDTMRDSIMLRYV
jgi:hypothetical protein